MRYAALSSASCRRDSAESRDIAGGDRWRGAWEGQDEEFTHERERQATEREARPRDNNLLSPSSTRLRTFPQSLGLPTAAAIAMNSTQNLACSLAAAGARAVVAALARRRAVVWSDACAVRSGGGDGRRAVCWCVLSVCCARIGSDQQRLAATRNLLTAIAAKARRSTT